MPPRMHHVVTDAHDLAGLADLADPADPADPEGNEFCVVRPKVTQVG